MTFWFIPCFILNNIGLFIMNTFTFLLLFFLKILVNSLSKCFWNWGGNIRFLTNCLKFFYFGSIFLLISLGPNLSIVLSNFLLSWMCFSRIGFFFFLRWFSRFYLFFLIFLLMVNLFGLWSQLLSWY